jgi:hypothetical protein
VNILVQGEGFPVVKHFNVGPRSRVEVNTKLRSQMTAGDDVGEWYDFSERATMLVGAGDRVKEGIGVRRTERIEPFNVGVILGKFTPPKMVRQCENHANLGYSKS